MPTSPPVTVHVASAIHTMDPRFPTVEAVAVHEGRIVAVGTVEDITTILGERAHVIDRTFADAVLLPGLIDQHLHPMLGASALMTEVIATEDWVLPRGEFPAAATPQDYHARLQAAVANPATLFDDDVLLSWGYHPLWHGKLDRALLDTIAPDTPVVVWHRSCHEFYVNSAAYQRLGLDDDWFAGLTAQAQSNPTQRAAATQIDRAAGRFYEGGAIILLPKLAPFLLSEPRMRAGLEQLVAYLHQSGVTAFNEPGVIASEPFALYQEILGADDVPFLSTFLVDARGQAQAGVAHDEVVAQAQQVIDSAGTGKVRYLPKQVKFFADGAIISQLMQMNDPYVDAQGQPDPNHQGEWMTPPKAYAEYFRVYWKAGWQIHTHVNGDRGLDLVLDSMEQCMLDHPRADHRCVVVHFANSTPAQVDRIARVGAIVSANPYYPVGFSDKFGAWGLGPERADVMVRSREVLDRSIPLSYHSDMPMAVSAPLVLADFGEQRITPSGRVAGPQERATRREALEAVTIQAAYSWRLEHELGSITPGKAANFTVVSLDPFAADAGRLCDIPVVGTVFGGRWFPLKTPKAGVSAAAAPLPTAFGIGGMPAQPGHTDTHAGCGCALSARLLSLIAPAA